MCLMRETQGMRDEGDRQGWAGQEMIFISPEKLLMMGDTR